MTVPDYIISLAVHEEHRYGENRRAAAWDRPRKPREAQASRITAARQRLSAELHSLASTIDPPQAEPYKGHGRGPAH